MGTRFVNIYINEEDIRFENCSINAVNFTSNEAHHALIDLVNSLGCVGDLRLLPKERIKWFEAQLGAARDLKDSHSEVCALGNLGIAYKHLGDMEKALTCYDAAYSAASASEDRSAEAVVLTNMGLATAASGDSTQAKIMLQLAEKLCATGATDRHVLAAVWSCLGLICADLGENDSSIRYFSDTLKTATDLGDCRGQANALGNLGNSHLDSGNFAEASKFFCEQRALVDEIRDRRGIANCLGNLGVLKNLTGEHAIAEDCLAKALLIHSEIGDRRGKGNDLGNQGNLFLDCGDAPRACRLFEEAHALDLDIGDGVGVAADLYNLARAHLNLGDQKQALIFAEQSLLAFRQHKPPLGAKVEMEVELWKKLIS